MDKECRDKLNEIKGQSYKLFLHNLLEKEERTHRKVRRIRFKYFNMFGGGRYNGQERGKKNY